ncbi:hypothetical protein BH11ARM1_BH11ARM1_15130 [soil metagenome]
MSAYLQEEIWVVVEQLNGPHAPRPMPLESGFSPGSAYRVIGLHCPSETSEAYFILCNDRDEVWFISNRHFRVKNGQKHRAKESDLAIQLM